MSSDTTRIGTLAALGLVGWLAPLGINSKALQGFSLATGLICQTAACAQSKKAIVSEGVRLAARDNEAELIAHEMSYSHEAELERLRSRYFPAPQPVLPDRNYPYPLPTPQQPPQYQPALNGGYIGQNTIAPSAVAPPTAPTAPVAMATAAAGNISPWDTIAPDLEGYFAILLYGSQGSGKTTIANWIISRRRSNGHRIIVLDPHRELGQWEGCEVVGDGMDYEAIDAKLLSLMAEVKDRYRRRSTAKGARFEPITIVAEELTLWGEHCENVSLFLKSALADFRKIGLHLILIAHGKTNTILGGSKGTAATREATLLEVNPLAIPDPRSPSGVRSKGEALVKMPNESEVIVVAVPDLSAPATISTAPVANTAAATNTAPIPANTAPATNTAPDTDTAALERALATGPSDLHWKAVELSLAKGEWMPLRDIQRSLSLPSSEVTRGLINELLALELGEAMHDEKYNRLLFRAYEPDFSED